MGVRWAIRKHTHTDNLVKLVETGRSNTSDPADGCVQDCEAGTETWTQSHRCDCHELRGFRSSHDPARCGVGQCYNSDGHEFAGLQSEGHQQYFETRSPRHIK